MSTDAKVDITGVEKSWALLLVSIDIWERCRLDPHLSYIKAWKFIFLGKCKVNFRLFSHINQQLFFHGPKSNFQGVHLQRQILFGGLEKELDYRGGGVGAMCVEEAASLELLP